MDEIDRAILRTLRDDARISFRDLGETVGLSANAVADRVRRLVSAGTIRRFRAEIDPSAGGTRLSAFVDLRLAAGTPADGFEAALRALPGVVAASLTTGNFDYTLRVAVADEPALVTLIEALRASGASETHSRIILRETILT
jgi:Lrp/AsnC family leucine-responsive transcriptional regulator